MKFLFVLIGLLWAAANLYVAYTFVTAGFLQKTINKGLMVQGALVMGGLLIAVFALFLLVQSVLLAVQKTREA